MSSPNPEPAAALPRLQKVLASAGVASRRASEDLIASGKVSINGTVVTRLGSRVDPDNDVIHVNGERLILDESRVYLALHKPPGVLSAMADDRGGRTLAEFVPQLDQRVFHVGRLDTDSEGLLLLTNDGELAHRLMHPSFGVTKTYVCQVDGRVAPKVGRLLRTGVELEDGTATADAFRVREVFNDQSMVEISLHSGRKRVVRRMLAEVGHPVRRLIRTSLGPIKLGQLRPGAVRQLTKTEIGQLYKHAGL